MPTPSSPTVPRLPSDLEPDRDASHNVSNSSASPVEQLVALRDALNAAVRRANEAIRALKRQRREDRLLRATLASLRQLQDLAS